MKNLLNTLTVASVLALSACSGQGGGTSPNPPTPTPPATNSTGSVTPPTPVTNFIESNLGLIRTGSAVATGAALDFAVTQASTRTRDANDMYLAASAIYSLTGGAFPTPAQLQATVLGFGGSQADATYAGFASTIGALYASYYPKLVTGDTKTASDLLNAIAGGIEDATASYVTTPAPSASLLATLKAPALTLNSRPATK
jgi:hypothetical protein